jgi:formamidopyrimidine-DNA glycosylase
VPELPEVETTRRGIAPHLEARVVTKVIVRDRRLRWPVPDDIGELQGTRVCAVERRAKYLLIKTNRGTAIVHLGMSGSLRMVASGQPALAHDHVDIVLDNGQALRLHDPRRFGCLLWTPGDAQQHPLLASLGPEPLGEVFSADYLYRLSRKRRVGIKQLIMTPRVVVGIGNIYASEALFRAGINPFRAAGRISKQRYAGLVDSVRAVLNNAIGQGGTTLRDFLREDGNPGYFKQSLRVYAREGQACRRCKQPIKRRVQGQRSTFYCPRCQR